jgi:lipid II:glycine glycyltransferase (peptidoglycan interpeptide bridge formation enzyme)
LIQARYNRRFGFGDRVEVGGTYGYGPVTEIEDEAEVSKELITHLENRAIKSRVSEALIYRPRNDPILESLGYSLTQVFNIYKVTLPKTEEELRKSIAHNKRRNIKQSQEQGVKVVQSKSPDSLASFFEIHAISGKRAGFTTQPFSYFNSYLKVLGEKGKVQIFLTVYNGQPVAGVFVVIHGDTAYALGAGSREEIWRVRPNDLLHWEAMKWACSKGLSWYHMGYVSEPPPAENSLGWGLWRWKREWNGQLEKVYVYHRVYMPHFKKFVLTPYEKIYRKA